MSGWRLFDLARPLETCGCRGIRWRGERSCKIGWLRVKYPFCIRVSPYYAQSGDVKGYRLLKFHLSWSPMESRRLRRFILVISRSILICGYPKFSLFSGKATIHSDPKKNSPRSPLPTLSRSDVVELLLQTYRQ